MAEGFQVDEELDRLIEWFRSSSVAGLDRDEFMIHFWGLWPGDDLEPLRQMLLAARYRIARRAT